MTGIAISHNVCFSFSALPVGGACSFLNPRTLQFTKCIFTNNTAPKYGGALAIRRSANDLLHCELNHCHFSHNTASGGGAVYITNGNMTIRIKNSTFTSNQGPEIGGALCFNGTSVNISHSEFSHNNSTIGGAISFIGLGQFCTLHITHSKILGNNNATNFRDTLPASAIYIESAKEVFMSNVMFHNNSAGGALRLLSHRCEIHNCSFWGNTGTFAGAISSHEDTYVVLITNCSFVENKAPQGDLLFGDHKVILQSCYFGKPYISEHRIWIYGKRKAELRSYNNVFIESNSFAAPIVFLAPTPLPSTNYIWKTYYKLKNNELLPVDQQNMHNQSIPTLILEVGMPNTTQVFSQYASGGLKTKLCTMNRH